jgi:branched-chain amino acid aminotransferase
MTITAPIPVQRTTHSRIAETDFNNLEFGKYISDHMLMSDWAGGKWSEPVIVPFGELKMTPAILSLHYGQSIFEGMKAYKNADGSVNIFRPHKHLDRMNKSLDRMCMPHISFDMFISSLQALIEVDRNWIPTSEGASLYIRPIVFATESRLGVKVSDFYKFIILTSPVGPYYSKPFRLKVEDHFTRTAEGGTGFAKCAGNYGGAFYPTQVAKQEGFDQILWTDHKEHKYIDEVGMMNVMFLLNEKLVTPNLNSAILDGITRDSLLTIAREMGITVEERRISIDELEEGFKKKTLTEAFGAGTAAVVAPIAVIRIHGTDYQLPAVSASSLQQKLKSKLMDIRMGAVPDTHGWNYIVKK